MPKLAIKLIRTDGGTQSRAEINRLVVDEYADDLKRGDVFPPVDVFYDGESYWISRGWHRLSAHVQLGRRDIDATIHQGDVNAAILYSVGDNAKHGLRRTNDDKRRAVALMFASDVWRKWSDRKIASVCGVSNAFVSGMRAELANDAGGTERLAERNGKTYTIDTAGLRSGSGVVNKDARDLIRETRFADDREFVRKLGLVADDKQLAVATMIVSGDVKTIAQAERRLERQAKAAEWTAAAKTVELDDDACTIHTGDCRNVLSDVPARSIDLVFTDPPYGIGEGYPGFNDNLTRGELMELLGGFTAHLTRVLKPHGSVFMMMSSRYALDVAALLDAAGLYRQDMIVWAESFGAHNPKFWTDSYRVILHYTRDPDTFTFNHADARAFIPSWRNENGDSRQDTDGKLPGNVWGVWTDRELARRVGNAGERIPDGRAVNQLPVKLVERVVLLASNPGDTVLDAFHGTGTTARACIPHKRRYVGIEIDPAQAKASRKWIRASLAQRKAVER